MECEGTKRLHDLECGVSFGIAELSDEVKLVRKTDQIVLSLVG